MMAKPSSSAAAVRDGAGPPSVREQLAALAALRPPDTEFSWLAVPAPAADPLLFVEGAPRGFAAVWLPPEGTGLACVGAAEVVFGSKSDRMQQVNERGSTLLKKVRALGDASAPSPRCLGGFAFRADNERQQPWGEFGDAQFVLPRLSYARRGPNAWVVLVLRADEDARPYLDEVDRGLARLRRVERAVQPPPDAVDRADLSPAAWRALVEAAKQSIMGGRLEKVVTARRTAVRFASELDPVDVLSRLGATSSGCTRFAFRFGASTFLGASPERLVRRRGDRAETEALAGSIRTDGAESSKSLMGSVKERSEHELVVREITRLLAPIAGSVQVPLGPEARTFRHIQHLRTPIHITLSSPLHVLRLVDRLHPTPAVGGVPTREALTWISEHEGLDRGWYAGPVGWFDCDGDGDFAVALRSGLIHGDTAHLYAGGGVVAGSDPDAEYAETGLKLDALASALGLAQ